MVAIKATRNRVRSLWRRPSYRRSVKAPIVEQDRRGDMRFPLKDGYTISTDRYGQSQIIGDDHELSNSAMIGPMSSSVSTNMSGLASRKLSAGVCPVGTATQRAPIERPHSISWRVSPITMISPWGGPLPFLLGRGSPTEVQAGGGQGIGRDPAAFQAFVAKTAKRKPMPQTIMGQLSPAPSRMLPVNSPSVTSPRAARTASNSGTPGNTNPWCVASAWSKRLK